MMDNINIAGVEASDNSILRRNLRSRKNNFLNVGHFNSQSILPTKRAEKFDDIKSIIQNSFLDIVGVSETWLKSYHTNSTLKINGYKIVRNDRSKRTGGGVAFFISTKIKFKIIEYSPVDSLIEYLFIQVNFSGVPYLLGVVYRPSGDINILSETFSDLSSKYENIIIMGDLNQNLLNDFTKNDTIDFFDNFNLSIHSNAPSPTHFDVSHNSVSLIDFFVLSKPDLVDFSDQFWIPSISKHAFIYLSINCPVTKIPNIYTYRDYNNLDEDELISEAFNIDLSFIYNIPNVDSKLIYFNSIVLYLFDKYVPVKTKVFRSTDCPWRNADVLRAISLRDDAFKLYKANPSNDNWSKYKVLRNKVTEINRNARRDYGELVFDQVTNTKEFWKKAKNLGVLENNEQETFVDNIEVLNNYFTGTHNAVSPATDFNITNLEEKPNALSFRNISMHELYLILNSQSSNAVGLDGIHLKFIKLIFPVFGSCILHIINTILTTSLFPTEWKKGRITPVAKIINPQTISDFRPITILSSLSKLCECAIKEQILKFIDNDPRVSFFPNQSGFRSSHSTITALLGITEKIRENFDKKFASILLLLDFSKAFDTISHVVLCKKLLSQFCFSHSATKLIFSYLSDRLQCTRAGDLCSNFNLMNKGVPQGSILGPLLFIIYINDLPTVVKHSLTHLFADDVQLMVDCSVDDLNNGVAKMNDDLVEVHKWAHENQLQLNVSKTQVVAIYKRPIKHLMPSILLNGVVVPYSSFVKSLGVFITEELKWDKQAAVINKRIYFILKKLHYLKHFLPQYVRLKLVKCLIVPHFLYGCEIFSGCDVSTYSKLERSLNSATRFVYSLGRYDHISHLTESIIGYSQLKTFYNMRCLIMLFKILKSSLPAYLYSKFNRLHSLRTNQIRFPRFNSRTMELSFVVRVIRLWNHLPNSITANTSVGKFITDCKVFLSSL